MANALPILLIGGAALLMMGGKKKGDTRTALPKPGELVLPPTTPPPLTKTVKKSGSGYPGVTRARMQEIQTMLVANGYDVGPKGLDGRYGSATKQAVWEFQEDWGPSIGTPDGKPGPKTQGALEKAEADRVQGQREEAQKFPEEAVQLIDECDPLAAGTWGSGNVCEWNGSRWVRAVAKMSPTPKAKAAPAPEPEPEPGEINDFAYCLSLMESTWKWTGGYDLRMADDPAHVENKESQWRHLLHRMSGPSCQVTKVLPLWERLQIMYDFAANKGDVALAKYIQAGGPIQHPL